MDVSLNGGTPKTSKIIIFSRKTHGCWVPPFKETPICFALLCQAPLFSTRRLKVSPADVSAMIAGSCDPDPQEL